MATILAILNFLFGWAIKAWQARGPAPVVVEAEKAGAAQADLAGAQQALKTETAVAEAEADAPRTQAADVAALDKDTF